MNKTLGLCFVSFPFTAPPHELSTQSLPPHLLENLRWWRRFFLRPRRQVTLLLLMGGFVMAWDLKAIILGFPDNGTQAAAGLGLGLILGLELGHRLVAPFACQRETCAIFASRRVRSWVTTVAAWFASFAGPFPPPRLEYHLLPQFGIGGSGPFLHSEPLQTHQKASLPAVLGRQNCVATELKAHPWC